MKLKSGDQVVVLKGKDKGKKGKIEKVFPKTNKVLITGINIFKRHKKPTGRTLQGGIIDIVKPLPVSNVVFECPKCKLPSKIGYKVNERSKERICKKCSQVI